VAAGKNHTVVWEGTSASGPEPVGIYVVELRTHSRVVVKKLMKIF